MSPHASLGEFDQRLETTRLLGEFKPFYTPKQMLEMGVFEGRYLNATRHEYPADWFAAAKLTDRPDEALNHFGLKSRLPLSEWQVRGWIDPQDPLGWFQWYARFSLGRRSADDNRQIRRWLAFVRHSRQVELHGGGDVTKRRRQRQALLQWAHDPYPDCR